MDVKAALTNGTKEQFAHAMAGPEGWDRWVGGLTFTNEGPAPIMAGVVGALGVLLDPRGAGAALHPHDSAQEALECFEEMAKWVRENAVMINPLSTDASQPPAALPISTDDPTAVPFWL